MSVFFVFNRNQKEEVRESGGQLDLPRLDQGPLCLLAREENLKTKSGRRVKNHQGRSTAEAQPVEKQKKKLLMSI